MATKIGGRPAELRHVLRDERPVGLLALRPLSGGTSRSGSTIKRPVGRRTYSRQG
jgi:hypothetical protein